MTDWQTDKPPNEVWVEVRRSSRHKRVFRARAIWGWDGTLPHWEDEDGTVYFPNYFGQWREVREGRR